MTFTTRDLRPGTDVFSMDNVYLGTVIRVRWEGSGWLRGGRWASSAASPIGEQAAYFSGEHLGPMPTWDIGNGGPTAQSAHAGYACQDDGPPWEPIRQPAELLIFRWLVSLNWATARPVLWRIPAGLIHLASLERIVLAVNADDLH